MALHLAARFHAFWHSLFRPSDKVETLELYERVRGLLRAEGLETEGGRQGLVDQLTTGVLAAFDLAEDHPQRRVVWRLVSQLFQYEKLFLLPEIDWSERRSTSAYWAIRDELNSQRILVEDFPETCELLQRALVAFVAPVYEAVPGLLNTNLASHDIQVETPLIHCLKDAGAATEAILQTGFAPELAEAGVLTRLAGQLERNLIEVSGGNPADPKSFSRPLKLPTRADTKNPEDLVASYLHSTPLLGFLEQTINFAVPTASRFEHHHIVAGSGHGKTQTLQYLIARDLEAVAAGERSVIVLDSQGDLIRNISQLAEFSPGGVLHDQIVIIDPSDVEWPVSLNLFDVGIERLSGYAPLERERLTNSILELYDFVLGTLLAAEMTQKQSVIFRYVTRLMLYIPDATIHTLRELMEPNSQVKFAEHIAKLEGTAKHFFETEFASKEFEQTKKQVLRRLWGILENQTFERMFSHPRSKLDLFSEMNAGKVILINTAKDLLKEQGTEIFGRFFIAMIAQAAQERATLPERDRLPTMVYIDEAQDYFDKNIKTILEQARKYKVGMVLAHQYLGQLEPKLQEAFAANTAIKFAGGVSAKDARVLASMLYCDPALIERQRKGGFATHIRGVTSSALPLQFTFGYLEKKDRMTKAERTALQIKMRERYAIHYSELAGNQPAEEGDTAEEVSEQETAPDRANTSAGGSW
jgi:hypothetical protein